MHRIAPIATDPQLQAASGPFGTWTGVIRVDAAGDAWILRRNGDEDQVVRRPIEWLDAVTVSLAAQAGARIDPGTETWIGLRELQPVLSRLAPTDAFDVVTRLLPPTVEHVDAVGTVRAVSLWAALVGDEPGWFGGVVVPA